MNKKGEIAINKIITLILVVLVIALVLFFYFRQDIWNSIRNLPGYVYNDSDKEIDYSSLSDNELSEYNCKPVGKIMNNYIVIGQEKTNLYLQGNKIWLDKDWKDLEIGTFDENLLHIYYWFLKESEEYILNKEKLPIIDRLTLIDNSFTLGNLLCKKEEQIAVIQKEKSCVEDCSLYNGNCRASGLTGEINLGKINCKKDELCYVKEKDETGKFDETYIITTKEGYSDRTDFLKINELAVTSGKPYVLQFSFSYGKENLSCYIARTNDKILESGYLKENENLRRVVDWMPSNEKSFEIVVWMPWENKKILKRIKINSEIPEKYSGGKFITNENFKSEISYGSIGDIFYITGTDILFNYNYKGLYDNGNFKIEKISSDKLRIYARFGEWKELDCDWWWGATALNIKDIKDTFKDSIYKNNCKP